MYPYNLLRRRRTGTAGGVFITFREKNKEDVLMKNLNLQDVFLNQARKERISIIVYLVNGFQFRGIVKGFDNYTVILESDGKQQLVYKHAISTIIPQRPISILNGEEEG